MDKVVTIWTWSLNKIICAKLFYFIFLSQSFYLTISLIQRPRIYLLGKPDCLRGFTKMGKTITPTVKRHIGATTINIDSRDMNNFEFINK